MKNNFLIVIFISIFTLFSYAKISNPIVMSEVQELELHYVGYTKEYQLNTKISYFDINFIVKDGEVSIKNNLNNNEVYSNTKEPFNEINIATLPKGEYTISIYNAKELSIKSRTTDLSDKVIFTRQIDNYKLFLDKDYNYIKIKEPNELSNINFFGNNMNYDSKDKNSLDISNLKEGEYEINIYTSLTEKVNTQELKEMDSRYKFSNLKAVSGFKELDLSYVSFERHYFFDAKINYTNLVIQKESEGCGIIIKNLSNGGEVINSCESESENKLNIELLKRGDYVISIINAEEFSIHSNERDLKDKLKLNGKSDKYRFTLEEIKRNILIEDTNKSTKLEIFRVGQEDLKYSRKEYPFNFLSIPFLNKGIYRVNIDTLIVGKTTIEKPLNAEVIESEERTEINTKPINLNDKLKSKIKTLIAKSGIVEAIINISDENNATLRETQLKAPKGSEVAIDDNGTLTQILRTINTKTEVIADSSGRIETKINITDEDNNQSIKREFKVPAGSQSEISEDGSATALNEIESSDGDYETSVEVKPDGEVSASAFMFQEELRRSTKISTGLLKASFTARREFSSVKVEIIFDDELYKRDLRTTKISTGLLTATYTTRLGFSFRGENYNYNRTNREVDISSANEIIITPSSDASFEENQYFLGELDGYRTIKLMEGEANISVDSENSIMLLNQEYVLPKVDGKELNLAKGWNLISLPIDIVVTNDVISEDANYTIDSFGDYSEIWKFSDKIWTKNPEILKSGEGFWINLNSENRSLFVGASYDLNLSNLSIGWSLLGAGEDISDINSEDNFKQIYKFSRDNNATTWIKNPNTIYRGEGFWVEIEN